MTTYLFVVDTDSFAGNFERQMCAFMTGQIGECGVGAEQAKLFVDSASDALVERMEALIGMEPDDNGCWRPAKIYPNPSWFNNGRGGHYRKDDPTAPNRAQIDYDEDVKETADRKLRIYEDADYAERQAVGFMQENYGKPYNEYPAFMSVAIVLNEAPTAEDISVMKQRATEFAAGYLNFEGKPAPVTIEGFRLVEERVVVDARSV